jgi:pantoate kinase
VKKTAKAFAPGAISSFFEIHDIQNGKPIVDLRKVGAIGGGFGLTKGVYTTLTAESAQKNSITATINGQHSTAKTTCSIIEALLGQADKKYAVNVEHQIEVPVGMGFGTSAGGSLTAGLALREALDLPLTYNQVGQAAHAAEIQCLTGLGTVSSLNFGGGLILVTQAGAPGFCKIDRIPIPPRYQIVVGYYRERISKKSVLASPQKKAEINGYGRKALKDILKKPSLENFLACCWDFAQNAGFATEGICKLVDVAKKAGAVGAAQNMIGEAVHAVVDEENAVAVAEAFKQTLPFNQVFISGIDFQGARLIK